MYERLLDWLVCMPMSRRLLRKMQDMSIGDWGEDGGYVAPGYNRASLAIHEPYDGNY